MAQFESARGELDKAGLRVAFIAGQSCSGLLGAERHFRSHPSSFPYFCDKSRDVLRTYGVYRPVGMDGVRVAHPSVLLIDPQRKIRFIYIGENQSDRLTPEQVLKEFREQSGSQ